MASLRWTSEEYAAYRRRIDGLAPQPLPASVVVQPDRFFELCAAARLPLPAREVLLIPGRDYRFDYVWPRHKIAVEQQGYKDHSSRAKLRRDYDKLNLAQAAGWKVYQFTPKQLAMVETIEWLREQLAAVE